MSREYTERLAQHLLDQEREQPKLAVLVDADPNCDHIYRALEEGKAIGIKCRKCGGWYISSIDCP